MCFVCSWYETTRSSPKNACIDEVTVSASIMQKHPIFILLKHKWKFVFLRYGVRAASGRPGSHIFVLEYVQCQHKPTFFIMQSQLTCYLVAENSSMVSMSTESESLGWPWRLFLSQKKRGSAMHFNIPAACIGTQIWLNIAFRLFRKLQGLSLTFHVPCYKHSCLRLCF